MKILDFDLEGNHFIMEAEVLKRQQADDDDDDMEYCTNKSFWFLIISCILPS